jgi:ribosomal protein S18 acetylase RimI-like enzyme
MNTGLSRLIELRKHHIKQASRMLARAFCDDPIIGYALANDKDAANRISYVYEFMLRYYLSFAQGYATSDRLEGVAIWQRWVAKGKMSLWHLLVSGAVWPAFRIGIKVGQRMQPFFNYVDSKHVELISSPHWYLALMGVDPLFQGKGYASILLRGMLSKIDEEGSPCYLETEKEGNVPIYQHFNFKVVDEYIVPETSVKLWAMLRESRPVQS